MKKLGLIGYPLTHSFSKKYFEEKFLRENEQDFSYELFPIENIEELPALIEKEKNLVGLNVTTPYKERVLDYLDSMDEVAQATQAANCILISRNENKLKDSKNKNFILKGFNTDAEGFRYSIKPFLESQHERALILGTGGAANAVKYILENIGIPCWLVSRTHKNDENQYILHYTELTASIISQFKLIINASPVGTFPNQSHFPQIPYEGIGLGHLAYDLVYNPAETLFLQKAKANGAVSINGLSMLYHQADEAFKIWKEHA